MRVFTRIALALLAVALLAQPVFSQQQQAGCPLTLVASNPPASGFAQSPHGVFRFGSQVFVLRGQTLTTYTVTDLGDMQIAREDFISGLAGQNQIGAAAFSNGYLYVSSEGGLEVFDLRNVRAGGGAPISVTRLNGMNYHRLAVSGNTLVGLFPGTDMPCASVAGQVSTSRCSNQFDVYNITNPASLNRVASVSSITTGIGLFNDVAFNFGTLIVTGLFGTTAYDVSTASNPRFAGQSPYGGTFLVSNGSSLVGIGNDTSIITLTVGSPFAGFTPLMYHSPATVQVGRSNRVVFHPQAYYDDSNSRLITLIDEIDPARLVPARTIAIDVFQYNIPPFEGRDPRIYESVSYLDQDEVKWNPAAVGPLVYVVGEVSGLQTYGDCGQMAGRIEVENVSALPCGGAEIHGWVTGAQKINSVELFLDGNSLGFATIGNIPRLDVPSTTPVFTWRIGTLLDQTTKGQHTLRAVGTDVNNNRRQFASQNVFFPGPGQNCFNRRRTTGH